MKFENVTQNQPINNMLNAPKIPQNQPINDILNTSKILQNQPINDVLNTSKILQDKDSKFDLIKFNNDFNNNDIQNENLLLLKQQLKELNDKEYLVLPHKLSIEDIFFESRDLFFQVFNLISEKKNPISFIFISDKRILLFSIFLICFGMVLLFLSSLK